LTGRFFSSANPSFVPVIGKRAVNPY